MTVAVSIRPSTDTTAAAAEADRLIAVMITKVERPE